MVERLHRQLKAAIKCHNNSRWTKILPSVLLGIRSAWKEDMQSTAAEMLYGQQLRLPGELLCSADNSVSARTQSAFVKELREHMSRLLSFLIAGIVHCLGVGHGTFYPTLRPTQGTRHGTKSTFIFKGLRTSHFVFLRTDSVQAPLQNPYEGPFKVISRGEKTFVIEVRGKNITVSIDRLKPAYIAEDIIDESDSEDDEVSIYVPAPILGPEPLPRDVPQVVPVPEPAAVPEPNVDPERGIRTRAGRRVRFPDRLQAGFS
ncbi:uncharacterized protein LOC127281059 [Leptopilina boulardi]|uniref:uncharacterized protein LOC127281059 n=1 Tax=Leptopilina boulardi TaxID=63433 RepID=UPI0021F565A7|nr:uncharacterized protein LOC127281059 [Leptopilina boulardi]